MNRDSFDGRLNEAQAAAELRDLTGGPRPQPVDAYVPELLFDATVTATLDRARRALVERGLVPALDPTPPHLSLACIRDLDVVTYSAGPTQNISALPVIELAEFGTFSGVLFLRPEPAQALRDFHAQFQAAIMPAVRNQDALYLPAAFVPHVTLGTDIAPERMAEAQDLCRSIIGHTLSGRVVDLALFELPSGKRVG